MLSVEFLPDQKANLAEENEPLNNKNEKKSFLVIFTLSLPVMGFKPFIFNLRDKCPTNVLSPLAIKAGQLKN
jgi:hypothetical protein